MPIARRKRTSRRPVATPGTQSALSWIIARFFGENMIQTSAALAFTTLLALVPLLTVVLALTDVFPFIDPSSMRLDLWFQEVLLPPGAAVPIVAGIERFIDKARHLTWAGIGVLAVTAFMLLHTIERVFNHLWQVEPRPLLVRLGLYAFVMAAWPLLLGAVVAAMSLAVTTSLGWIGETGWVRHALVKAASLGMLGLFFSFLYYAVPNARVSGLAALVGGIFSALAFAGMQKVFEFYLVSSALIKSIYGAFAAFPVFLLWLHASWAIVLLGGLIAATASRPLRR